MPCHCERAERVEKSLAQNTILDSVEISPEVEAFNRAVDIQLKA
jgi:hypothetical protein